MNFSRKILPKGVMWQKCFSKVHCIRSLAKGMKMQGLEICKAKLMEQGDTQQPGVVFENPDQGLLLILWCPRGCKREERSQLDRLALATLELDIADSRGSRHAIAIRLPPQSPSHQSLIHKPWLFLFTHLQTYNFPARLSCPLSVSSREVLHAATPHPVCMPGLASIQRAEFLLESRSCLPLVFSGMSLLRLLSAFVCIWGYIYMCLYFLTYPQDLCAHPEAATLYLPHAQTCCRCRILLMSPEMRFTPSVPPLQPTCTSVALVNSVFY